MSQRHRAPNRAATRKSAVVPPPRLRVAVATFPASTQAGLTLARDVELVKSAMLYADEVRLVSPGSELVLSAASLANSDGTQLIQVLISLPDETLRPMIGGQADPEEFRELLFRMWSQRYRPGWREFVARSGLGEHFANYVATARGVLASSGGDEILAAIRSGLVSLGSLARPGAGDGRDVMARAFIDELRDLVGGRRWQLLVDSSTGKLVRSLVAEDTVSPGAFLEGDARRAAVGAGIIARLPAFPELPVSEIVDLRSDLAGPLSQYRRATRGLATKLRVGPFDAALAEDLDDLFRSDIEPALQELREGMADHGLVREVGRHLKVGLWEIVTGVGVSSVNLAISNGAGVSGVVQGVLGGLPVVAGAAGTVHAGVAASREEREKLRRHDLVYLAEIERRGGAD